MAHKAKQHDDQLMEGSPFESDYAETAIMHETQVPLEESETLYEYDPAIHSSQPIADETPRSSSVELVRHFTLVEGFTITPGLDRAQALELAETVHSYIGVIPTKIDAYANRWIKMLGCVVSPVTKNDEVTDRSTGEILVVPRTFTVPLFKIDSLDDLTGMHKILSGGGQYGLAFAREMCAIFGVGDWPAPRMVMISQQPLQADDGSPRRMYRFVHLSVEKHAALTAKK